MESAASSETVIAEFALQEARVATKRVQEGLESAKLLLRGAGERVLTSQRAIRQTDLLLRILARLLIWEGSE